MRSRIGALSLLLLTVLPGSPQQACAQSSEKVFERFRILLHTGQRMEGYEGLLTETALEGRRESGTAISIPLDDIRTLDVSRGSKASRYAAIGVGMGLLTSLYAVLSASWSPEGEETLDTAEILPITLGATVGGGLLGMVIGLGSPNWERMTIPNVQGRGPLGRIPLFRIEIPF